MYEIEGLIWDEELEEFTIVPFEDANFFGVYLRGVDGLAKWLEDFGTLEAAQSYVEDLENLR